MEQGNEKISFEAGVLNFGCILQSLERILKIPSASGTPQKMKGEYLQVGPRSWLELSRSETTTYRKNLPDTDAINTGKGTVNMFKQTICQAAFCHCDKMTESVSL